MSLNQRWAISYWTYWQATSKIFCSSGPSCLAICSHGKKANDGFGIVRLNYANNCLNLHFNQVGAKPANHSTSAYWLIRTDT